MLLSIALRLFVQGQPSWIKDNASYPSESNLRAGIIEKDKSFFMTEVKMEDLGQYQWIA